MSIDPDPIAERSRTVPRSSLKMDDDETLGDVAAVDDAIEELLDQ